jgi:hypothetical protein
MAFLYNVAAGRELREGDGVKVSYGPRSGRTGKVVGFDVLSDRPVVVQYDAPSSLLRESFVANDIEIRGYTKAPETREPLPEIRTLLKDSRSKPKLSTCGQILCLQAGKRVVSFVPKDKTVVLRQIYESKDHHTFEDRLSGLLRHAFVTRLPHLVRLP